MRSLHEWLSGKRASDADVASPSGLSPARVIDFLDDELLTTLGNLDGAPAGLADCVVQLLPLGSRTSLIELGVLERTPANGDDDLYTLKVTPFGFEVIKAVAEHNSIESADVQHWTEQATLAAEALEDN